jgi:hypothetical protein
LLDAEHIFRDYQFSTDGHGSLKIARCPNLFTADFRRCMLSYRHAFHAGNHADVLKHLVLIQLPAISGRRTSRSG